MGMAGEDQYGMGKTNMVWLTAPPGMRVGRLALLSMVWVAIGKLMTLQKAESFCPPSGRQELAVVIG